MVVVMLARLGVLDHKTGPDVSDVHVNSELPMNNRFKGLSETAWNAVGAEGHKREDYF